MAYSFKENIFSELPFRKKLYLYFRLSKLIKLIRSCLRHVIKVKTNNYVLKDNEEIINFDLIKEKKEKLYKDNYIFIENFFSENYYEYLKKNWPKKIYFDPPAKIGTFYNTFPKEFRAGLTKYPWIDQIIKNFLSKKSIDSFNELVGIRLKTTGNIALTDAGEGSQVPYHLDGTEKVSEYKDGFNLIIFLEGNDGENSGGLCLSHSNNYEDKYFEVTKLNNTAILYKTGYNIYHGFKSMKKNTRRKMMGVIFLPEKSS